MSRLWTHQEQALRFIRELPRAMLAMDMATGKTRVAIEAMKERGVRRALVLCPLSVIDTWKEEIAEYAEEQGYLVPALVGPVKNRAIVVDTLKEHEPVVFLCNYEACWREPLKTALLKAGLDMLILDESHRIKSPGSKVSWFVSRLAKYVPSMLALTGTPMPNSPLDIYAQYRALDPTIFGTRFADFRNRYAIMGGYGGYQVLSYQRLDELHEKMNRLAFRVRADDVLDLPDAMDVTRSFDLSPRARKAYDELKREMVTELGEGTLSADNALTKLLRLQQITSGSVPVVTEGGAERMEYVDGGKRDLLADLLADIDIKEPVVIFARFIQDLDNIRAVCRQQGRSFGELSGRRNDLSGFKAGQIDALAVQIQSGGLGVDLSRAKFGVYYSTGYSLGEYEQSRARLRRPPKGEERRERIVYFHLVAQNSVDRMILRAIRKKADIVRFVVDEMRTGEGS